MRQLFSVYSVLRTYLVRLCLCAAGVFLLEACSTAEQTLPPSPIGPTTLTDFSGYWEKNYQASDDFDLSYNLYIADIQRSINSASSRGNLQGLGGAGSADMGSIVGLARFTEEITRTPLLEIIQDDNSVSIERDDDFALRCDHRDLLYVSNDNSFGSETCGWNGEQLIFRMNLGGGLTIFHQVTLGPNGEQLNITTRVRSANVSTPLVISNYYQRYSPIEYDYDCTLTLTRNTVCSQAGSPLEEATSRLGRTQAERL